MEDKEFHEYAVQWASAFDAYDLPAEVIREVYACFLLLRWADYVDAEQEAMATFEDRPYTPILPHHLGWKAWSGLEKPHELVARLCDLAEHLLTVRGDAAHPMSAYLSALATPLDRILKTATGHVADFVSWIGELPFETPAERWLLLVMFDRVLATTGGPKNGVFSTLESSVRLMIALANPRPGERVYDPCFGYGNLLVEAWKQAESERGEKTIGAPALQVAGIERDAHAFLIGLTRMILAGIDTPHLEIGNSLEREAVLNPARDGYDLALADVPLGIKVLGRDNQSARHHSVYRILTNDGVGLFIQHTLSQLKPHGRAVIAVPEGFLFRGGAERELRRYLIEKGLVEAVISLPAGSYAPNSTMKGSLLILNKQGGANRVRMADAAFLFDRRPSQKGSSVPKVIAQQFADVLQRPELRQPRSESGIEVIEGHPGTGNLSRSIWEVSADELAAVDWDLSPRRREKGGLEDLLGNLKTSMGNAGQVVPLSEVAQVIAGRSIKSADLIDEPLGERPVSYIRIKDLVQGKVAHGTDWLMPGVDAAERNWALLPGDILLSKSGTIGKAAMVRNGAVGSVAASSLYVLRVNQQRLDPGFLLAYLASPSCRNWLAAQSRGTVIQHLNRKVLDALPVPLPPLPLQARAATQHREFGTDVLVFLTQATGTAVSNQLASWLAEFDSRIPVVMEALEDTPSLTLAEPLTEMASVARRWVEQGQIDDHFLRWLKPLLDALSLLEGIAEIPQGPGLLTVLQDAIRAFESACAQASGQLPTDAQARVIGEKLRGWMLAAVVNLISHVQIGVASDGSTLQSGSFAEFSIRVVNEGKLPLRNFRMTSTPDWGGTLPIYLGEGTTIVVPLSGNVPKKTGTFTIQIGWAALDLVGEKVNGSVELAFQIVESAQRNESLDSGLGNNPYIAGSALEPKHGHSLFFGRQELIAQISRQIAAHGNVVLLEGNRRAGKTSILMHLEGREAVPGWLSIHVSLQAVEGTNLAESRATASVFRFFAAELAKKMASFDIAAPLPDGTFVDRAALAGKDPIAKLKELRRCRECCDEAIDTDSPFADFRDYLEALLSVAESQGLGLLLMLDEFDWLQAKIDTGTISSQVLDNLRFLIQSYPNFSVILSGTRRMKRQREQYWSALYGLGTTVPVTALDSEGARHVVIEPARNILSYSSEAVDRILELTARQPFLIQSLCKKIFEYADKTKTRSITLGVIDKAAAIFVSRNEHFAELWSEAGKGPKTGSYRRQSILVLCAMSFKQGTHISFGTLGEQLAQSGIEVTDEVLDSDLDYLRELELVDLAGEIGDGHYRLTIPLMADWIEQHKDADAVASHARAEVEEENG